MNKRIYLVILLADYLLNQLHKKYDLILLDCAPGFDIEAIATMNVAGGLLLVTNPEYPAVVSAVKLAFPFSQASCDGWSRSEPR